MKRHPLIPGLMALLPLPLLALLLAASPVRAEWSLENPPKVPPPAPEGSKEPADPKSFEEVKMDFPIAAGPFAPTWDSIRTNHPGVPAWFNDAKFGVFIHWGPQASGKSGDWYARNIYREGSGPYRNHLRDFGHPSESGYKEVLKAWTAPKWDPEALTKRFADAGMRFMMVVGVHHDNFDLWDSKYQPWNSVRIGPKKDMIGGWAEAAKKNGMRFCITFHHEYSWWWWADAYKADTKGPKAGVPYDGNLTLADGKGKWWEGLDPRLLYNINLGEYHLHDVKTDRSGVKTEKYFPVTEIAFGRRGIFQDHQEYAKWYAERWARRIQDAIEKYDPDMFYTDGNSSEPFCGDQSGSGFKCDAARRVVADFYNRALAKNGKVDKIAFIKFQGGNPAIGVTSEVGVPRNIKLDQPWIGENPIGDWYYGPNYQYEAVNLVRSLLEYASHGGNYACAVPLTPEGDLEPACEQMLSDMGAWMKINGEGLYGSTAWKKWGEGPGRVFQGKLGAGTAAIPYGTSDFRFTQGKDGSVYAWCLAVPKPGETLRITSLGTKAKLLDRPIKSVRLLGGPEVPYHQEGDALTMTCPGSMPFRHAVGFKVSLQ